jgi:outer membrane protein OmpA-like peptidoglycan-associated protein
MNNPSKVIGLSIISAFLLSACDTTATGTNPNPRAIQGVAIGAAGGALAGAILGDNKKSILIGAALGAAAGGLIGNNLDKQEAALRGDLANDGTRIRNTGKELIVTLPEGITFDTDSTYVRDSFRPEINKIAANLQDYPDTTVDVIGHTDSTGGADYNQALSADRAAAVTDILLQQGVDRSRIVSYGRGEREPIASNDTESGKAQNRRVEIIIRPKA